MKLPFLIILVFVVNCTVAQDRHRKVLDIIVRTYSMAKFSPDSIYGMVIAAGKKIDILTLNPALVDLSTNNYRQLFGRTPGIYSSEHDGSGLQTSIATRGLGANRSWEFNMRQNGYDIAADPSGYPEAYYTPTLDATSKVEVFRGSSALQYGSQFGGCINYVLKENTVNKPLEFENTQTFGSFGLFNSFTAFGATKNKFSFYGFSHYRKADGFRKNSAYSSNSFHGKVSYRFKNGFVRAEYTHSSYLSQQPGGMHDSLLSTNADTSFRSRNWFQVPWNIAALHAEFNLSDKTKIKAYAAFTFADRNSIGFNKAITTMDTINSTIGSFNPRTVDLDQYKTLSSEARILHHYTLFNQKNVLSGGLRLCNSEVDRSQNGIGSTASNYDITVSPDANGQKFPRFFQFQTLNTALFAENLFKIGSRLSITPGFRYENIQSSLLGRSNQIPNGILPESNQTRNVWLMGMSTLWQAIKTEKIKLNLYSNFTQNYRPALYTEMIPSGTTEVVDPMLKDVSGHTGELGLKGEILSKKGKWMYDLNTFYLRCNDKIGVLPQVNGNLKTNIGDVESKGLEVFSELQFFNPFFKSNSESELVSIYISCTFQDARYKTWNNPNIQNNENTSILGKKVEYAPDLIVRAGLNYQFKHIELGYQFSHTGSVFTDATNTLLPNQTATVGALAAYSLHDASLSYTLFKNHKLKVGVNNLTHTMYAARRTNGYPGPGMLPGMGRSFYALFMFRL